MSRHPISSSVVSGREQKLAEKYVNFIVGHAVPKAITLSQIQEATSSDSILPSIILAAQAGNWNTLQDSLDPCVRAYYNVRSELTTSQDARILLRGSRIAVPVALQDLAIYLAHEGHQGITKTKSLLREKVWFPFIDDKTEKGIKACLPCQASVPESKFEPLNMSPLPQAQWQDLSMDFYGPLPTGELLLVIIDEYSRFPVVEIVRSTSANTVIPVLDKVLSTFGVPNVLKSDNGPPFNSAQFDSYAAHMGFKHRKITPVWPKANAEAERFMRNI